MTVIAWDRQNLVVDSRVTNGIRLVSDKVNKLRTVKHPQYGTMMGAFCGAEIVIDSWCDFIATNGFDAFEPILEDKELCSTLILINKTGQCFELDATGLYTKIDYACAYGSGQPIAEHYLLNGSDALTAVREAIKSNITCGGIIRSYSWRTKKVTEYDS